MFQDLVLFPHFFDDEGMKNIESVILWWNLLFYFKWFYHFIQASNYILFLFHCWYTRYMMIIDNFIPKLYTMVLTGCRMPSWPDLTTPLFIEPITALCHRSQQTTALLNNIGNKPIETNKSFLLSSSSLSSFLYNIVHVHRNNDYM